MLRKSSLDIIVHSVYLGCMVILLSVFLLGCTGQNQPVENKNGRYQIHILGNDAIFMNDTQTGVVKVVMIGSGQKGGHQLGIPFDKMRSMPSIQNYKP